MNCILSSRFIDTIPKERHVALQMRIGEESQRREKKQSIAQIYTNISYYGKLKEPTEVTEYRYPPFDRDERD